MHVAAVEDQPALWAVLIATTGEDGHSQPITAPEVAACNPRGLGALAGQTTAGWSIPPLRVNLVPARRGVRRAGVLRRACIGSRSGGGQSKSNEIGSFDSG